jgi:kynureninase
MFDLEQINRAAHSRGALTLWDLSHSAGAMHLDIEKSGADFAIGCGYKYLNGGPGAPAYLYVSKCHQNNFEHPLHGWMGHAAPFDFSEDYVSAPGLDRALSGTPPILSLLALDAALDAFEDLDMLEVRKKSERLCAFFIDLCRLKLVRFGFEVTGPLEAKSRGAQVSLKHPEGYAVCQALIELGVIGDFRAPDLLRFGFAPLTTRFVDVFDAAAAVERVMQGNLWDQVRFRRRNPVT